jgi:hypothetical protein
LVVKWKAVVAKEEREREEEDAEEEEENEEHTEGKDQIELKTYLIFKGRVSRDGVSTETIGG